jgi:alginate O-acetyltransferase complex protein AlgI
MFPQLIAGPIVTYDEISDRLYRRKITAKTALRGVGIFIFGLGLKVLLANPLGKLWSQAQAIGFESVSTPLAWMSVIAFSLQLYFDFFGYSLMAVGLGKMLGFILPENFKHPYVSVTMTEFWRRWHITLGRWFRDYVYIPLGGNRKGTPRTTINLLIVWLLTGLWHGAGYNYLLWGLIF